MNTIRIVVEQHEDGFTAYPLGSKGVILGQGDTYGEALADVRSAIAFYIDTFGAAALLDHDEILDVRLDTAEVAL